MAPRNDHRLTYLDQTSLELARATGRAQVIQCVWVYEHPLDYEGLQRFHQNWADSVGNRMIERSPLPFGRHRWVRASGPLPPIRISEKPRPREELLHWADELGNLPIDAVNGPSWLLVVQPLTDGSTAVSMLASHQIYDGVGAILAVCEGVNGNIRAARYEDAGTRTRGKAILSDLRQAARDFPETARTAIKAAKMFRAKREKFAAARVGNVSAEDSQIVDVPAIAIYVGVPEWDARAESLGGNSYSLVAGFAAKIADRLGRRRADGDVSLIIAINLRKDLDDDRALAMAFANATVDPANVATDLTEARNAVREAREKAKNEPDPTIEMLSIAPWLPESTIKGVAEVMFDYSESLPVACSNLGDLPPEMGRIDGTAAEYVFIRAIDTNVTLGDLKRSKGQLVLVSGRINGMVSISVEAYQLGAENTKERLRRIAEETLGEFGLTGTID